MADIPVHKLVNRWWKISFFCLLAILLVVLALAGYSIIDQGVTITYMQESCKDTDFNLSVLLRLTPRLQHANYQKDVLTLLRRQNSKEFIHEEGNTIGIGQLVFVFNKSGRLAEVKSLSGEISMTEPELETKNP